jgi:hypothetical protein
MGKESKQDFLAKLSASCGPLTKVARGNSLFRGPDGTHFYVRYSSLHGGKKGFFGLDRQTLLRLKKSGGYVCLVCDDADEAFLVPIDDIISCVRGSKTAYDDSYKVQPSISKEDAWLKISGGGRFDLTKFKNAIPSLRTSVPAPEEPDEAFEARSSFTHGAIQLLTVKIGKLLGYDVWCPTADRSRKEGQVLDRLCIPQLELTAPRRTMMTIQAVDVIWLKAGTFTPVAFFEIEHSTTVYSGLLRLNDIMVDYAIPKAGIVSFEKRRSLFERELARRTFQVSGLAKVCRFYNFRYVHNWCAELEGAKEKVRRIGEGFFKG